MNINKYIPQIKELFNDVINMTDTIGIIHNQLVERKADGKTDKKIESLLNVLAVYGKELDRKTRILQLNILRDEEENK